MTAGTQSGLWKYVEKLVRRILEVFFALFHRTLEEKVFLAFMQFLKFGIVGLSNTVISYVLYTISLLGFQKAGIFSEVDYLVAQVIAFVLSVLWSFYWNNKFVFTANSGEKRSVWKALLKTYVSYSFTGLFLNSFLLILWVQVLHISEFVAPIINLLVSVPLNFLINKFWAFRTEKKGNEN